MTLSNSTIQELRKILLEDYGRNLDTKEVSEIATSLVSYFDLLAEIYYQKNKNDNENSKNN